MRLAAALPSLAPKPSSNAFCVGQIRHPRSRVTGSIEQQQRRFDDAGFPGSLGWPDRLPECVKKFGRRLMGMHRSQDRQGAFIRPGKGVLGKVVPGKGVMGNDHRNRSHGMRREIVHQDREALLRAVRVSVTRRNPVMRSERPAGWKVARLLHAAGQISNGRVSFPVSMLGKIGHEEMSQNASSRPIFVHFSASLLSSGKWKICRDRVILGRPGPCTLPSLQSTITVPPGRPAP